MVNCDDWEEEDDKKNAFIECIWDNKKNHHSIRDNKELVDAVNNKLDNYVALDNAGEDPLEDIEDLLAPDNTPLWWGWFPHPFSIELFPIVIRAIIIVVLLTLLISVKPESKKKMALIYGAGGLFIITDLIVVWAGREGIRDPDGSPNFLKWTGIIILTMILIGTLVGNQIKFKDRSIKYGVAIFVGYWYIYFLMTWVKGCFGANYPWECDPIQFNLSDEEDKVKKQILRDEGKKEIKAEVDSVLQSTTSQLRLLNSTKINEAESIKDAKSLGNIIINIKDNEKTTWDCCHLRCGIDDWMNNDGKDDGKDDSKDAGSDKEKWTCKDTTIIPIDWNLFVVDNKKDDMKIKFVKSSDGFEIKNNNGQWLISTDGFIGKPNTFAAWEKNDKDEATEKKVYVEIKNADDTGTYYITTKDGEKEKILTMMETLTPEIVKEGRKNHINTAKSKLHTYPEDNYKRKYVVWKDIEQIDDIKDSTWKFKE